MIDYHTFAVIFGALSTGLLLILTVTVLVIAYFTREETMCKRDDPVPQKRRRQVKEALKQTGDKIDLDEFEGVDEDFDKFERDKFENTRRK